MPQTAAVCPKSSRYSSIPPIVAMSTNPPIPSVLLNKNRPISDRPLSGLPCRKLLTADLGVKRFREKFVTPMRIGPGIILRYPFARGLVATLSNALLAPKIVRLSGCHGSDGTCCSAGTVAQDGRINTRIRRTNRKGGSLFNARARCGLTCPKLVHAAYFATVLQT